MMTKKIQVIKRTFLAVFLIALFFNCSNKQVFERNKNDESLFKNTLLNSLEKETVLANEVFQDEDKFFVFPPYYTLKEINSEVEGFSDTFYYIDRKKNDNIDVNENVYLIISTKDGVIKKCMPIERKLFSIEKLKSNKFMVGNTKLELNKSSENKINISFTEHNN